jgi:hypothetical protein
MQNLPPDITQALYRFACAARAAEALRVSGAHDVEGTKARCDADATERKRRKSLKAAILKHLRDGEFVQEGDGA